MIFFVCFLKLKLMNKTILPILIVLIHALSLSSQEIQNSSNTWYFGNNAGIDFNTTPPTALVDGQLDTQEGVASVSDNNGELLFYTDGNTVWDRTHQAMPTANGTLQGHWSSTQSAIIVPNLGDPDIYYIFTTDELGGNNGLPYTTIDMSLPGNGSIPSPLGNVINGQLNIELISPVTEKVTGILKPDYSGYWVITHGWNNNSFYAYEVTCNGINTEPIISTVGNVHTGGSGNVNAVGYMKASIDGQRLALVNRFSGTIDVYDFDNINGIVSNEFEIKPNDPLIYGLEFSFSGDYLYIGGKDIISQYSFNTGLLINIEIDDPSALNNANVVRALQLGPDENIYVSVRHRKYISAIYNPEDNNPLLTTNAIHLDTDNVGRNCRFGLPNIFYFDLFPPDSLTLTACPNSQVEYNGEFYQAGTINEVNLVSTEGCDSTIIITVDIFDVNNETLQVKACQGGFYDYNGVQIPTGSQQDFAFPDINGCDSTVTVIVEAFDVNSETLQVKACEGEFYDYNGVQIPTGSQQDFAFPDINGCDSTVTVIVEAFDVNNETLQVKACEGEFYDYNGILIPTGSQQYFAFPDINGCDSIVTVIVEAFDVNNETLQVQACEGGFYNYNGVLIPAGSQQDFAFPDINGCDSIVTVIVNTLSTPNAIAQVQGTLTCVDVDTEIQGSSSTGSGTLSYDWQFGGNSISMNEAISVSEPGTYTLIITDIDNGCTDETQVEVFQDIEEPIAISTSSGMITCTLPNVTLDGGGSSGNGTLAYDWQDSNGSSIGNESTLVVNTIGNYFLIVTNNSNGCTANDSIFVAGDSGTEIGNFVFLDGNVNGIQEPWEGGVSNVYVELFSAGPDEMMYTNDDVQEDWYLTENNGQYLFDCVEPGAYYVKYDIDTDAYTFSPQYQGNDDELDSNADPYTGATATFSVVEGMPSDFSFDAGIHSSCVDFTYGGTIGQNQIICPGDEPETLHTVIPPSGGSGIPEYLWLKSTTGSSWIQIPNSNSENYNPGPLYMTTYFVRCIRKAGCNSFIIESENQVTITVLPAEHDYCIGGNITNPSSETIESTLSFLVDEGQSFKFYPNPVSNELTIVASTAKTTSISLNLYDSTGQLLKVLKMEAGDTSKKLSLKHYASGLYFLHIPDTKDSNYKVVKIIKN